MKVKFLLSMFFIAILIFNCNNKNAVSEIILPYHITEGSILKFGETDSFIIKFSNLIYEHNGKQIKIPIFQGTMGDILYKDFRSYCRTKNLLEEGYRENGFIVRSEKGKLTKAFRDFLIFYNSNILKNSDLNKPSRLEVDGGGLYLFYEFNIEGIPCVLEVITTTREEYSNPEKIKSIVDVDLNETENTPYFRYSIWVNYTSDKIPIL